MTVRIAGLLTIACFFLFPPALVQAEEENSGFGASLFADQSHPALGEEPVAVVETLETLGDIAPAAGETDSPPVQEKSGEGDDSLDGKDLPLPNVP